jgi:hypothetical protein
MIHLTYIAFMFNLTFAVLHHGEGFTILEIL